MGTKGAIFHNLQNARTSSGRTTRADVRTFAPLGLVPPVLFASQVDWRSAEVWGIRNVVALFASLYRTALTIGQMLVASEPGTHQFGPAPKEVRA